MLCHASQMDANGTQNRIFQERTNFKNLQGHHRLGLWTEESLSQAGATPQENSFMDLPRRRKSERKMLRSTSIPNENVWPRPVGVLVPAQELGPTAKDELQGPVESAQDPISRQPDAHPMTQPAQRVRASHALLSDSYNEAEADHTLKVAALTRVTSSLAAKASDAKQGVERLRKLLADRAVEPSIYEATQRERWMEERRQIATEELLKTVRDHLASLVKSPASSVFPSSPTREDGDVAPTAANLRRFLTPPHRPAARSPRKRRHPAPLPEDAFNRVRHHKQLLPLRLKVPVHRPFSQPPPKAKQAPSRNTENPSSPGTSAPTEPTIANTTSPTSSSNAILYPFPSSASALDAIPENQEATQIPPLEPPLSPGNGNGMATIWRSLPLRSKEEILADMDMHPEMPDYVQNLLAELDSTPVARVRLNTLRRSVSFPRRPASPAIARTLKRNSHANIASNTKRNTMTNTPVTPKAPSHSFNMPSPAPTPARTNINTNTSSHIHSSPSRRRLSALFSVSEMLSSRRSLNSLHPHPQPHPPNLLSSSAQLPALPLVSPSIGFTIMESSHENENEEEQQEEGTAEEPPLGQQPPIVTPIPPSASAITLRSVETLRDVRRSAAGVNTSVEDKMLARIRRRVSAALGRQ